MFEDVLKLKSSIEALRGRFFVPSEFPFIDPGTLPQGALAIVRAANTPAHAASRLSGRQLDALLLGYRAIEDAADQELVMRVIRKRFSGRIIRLIMALLQQDPHSVALCRLCSAMHEEADERDSYLDSGRFIWTFETDGGMIPSIISWINENRKDMEVFFTAFHIDQSAPLAEEIMYKYLPVCGRDGFETNRKYLKHIIEIMPAASLTELITNYLNAFELMQYPSGINQTIYEKLGDPYLSPEWEPYPMNLRDRFAQWKFIYLLKKRAVRYPAKFDVLSHYYKHIRNCRILEDSNIMVIDFGEVVVADLEDKPYSYFYSKKVFDREMKEWDDPDLQVAPTFARIDIKPVTARDYIIEAMEDDCIQLGYTGVSVLYIQELLDIKLGLEPDMRVKKTGVS